MITDDDLQAFLVTHRLEPRITPQFAAVKVAEHYGLPLAEASEMVGRL